MISRDVGAADNDALERHGRVYSVVFIPGGMRRGHCLKHEAAAAFLDMKLKCACAGKARYAATIIQVPAKPMFGCRQLINDKRRVSVLGHGLLERVD